MDYHNCRMLDYIGGIFAKLDSSIKQINHLILIKDLPFMKKSNTILSRSYSIISNQSSQNPTSLNQSIAYKFSPNKNKIVKQNSTPSAHTDSRYKSKSFTQPWPSALKRVSMNDSLMASKKHSSTHMRIQQENTQIQNKSKNVQIFVEQVISDPSILHKLIDYKMLISHYQAKIKNQIQEIESCKKCLQEEFEIYYELFGRSHQLSGIRDVEDQKQKIQTKRQKIMREIRDIQNQLKQIQNQEIYYSQINDKKDQIIGQALHEIRNSIKQQKLQYQQLHTTKTNSLNTLIKQFSATRAALLSKQDLLLQAKSKIERLQQQKIRVNMNKKLIQDRRKEYEKLKKIEIEELQKYKNNMITKNNNEKEEKKRSQKKLNDIMHQLIKIVEKGDLKKFYQLAKVHNVAVNNITTEIRRKHSTADSNSNHIELEKENQHQKNLMMLQKQNPALKKICHEDMSTVKTLEHTDFYKNFLWSQQKPQAALLDEEQFNKNSHSQQEKIKQLHKEESDLNMFIEELQKRCDQKNRQLRESEKSALSK